MKDPHPVLLWFYQRALILYPQRLRLEYRDQILQTVRDSHRDRHADAVRFWVHLYGDLFRSSLTERFYMVRENAFQRPLVLHTLALAAILSIVGGIAALTMQQMLRRGANQPQIDMAEWYGGEISAGEDPGNAIPPGYIDMERSLQPFVIFYDQQGRPGTGTGYLGQKLPVPPEGVFGFVRVNGSENVTWQPRPGVRLASVIRRIDGNHPGFLLTGRSLRIVEEQESLLWHMVFGIWFGIMLLLFGGALFLNRAQLAKTQNSTA